MAILTAQTIYNTISSDYGSMEAAEKLLKSFLLDYRAKILTQAVVRLKNLEEAFEDNFLAGQQAAVSALEALRDLG